MRTSSLAFIGRLVFRTIVVAATLPNAGNCYIVQPSEPLLDTKLPSLNISNDVLSTHLLDSTTSLGNNQYDIVCDPKMGSSFDLDDCLDSLKDFEVGRGQVVFTERPAIEGTVPRPFRWMGRKDLISYFPSQSSKILNKREPPVMKRNVLVTKSI